MRTAAAGDIGVLLAAARWIASSIASMTMALSIIFSEATELAMAISSALLAEMAVAIMTYPSVSISSAPVVESGVVARINASVSTSFAPVILSKAMAMLPLESGETLLSWGTLFGALDAQVRKELRRWLRKLHDEIHITSIFVTHDQEEALEVADRVVLMDHGKVEQIGTPEEVYRHPATPFVYGFLGSVNFFHGRVEGEAVRVGDDTLPHEPHDFAHGAEVVAFARPHELEIDTNPASTAGIAARINRVLAFGVTARIELDGINGATGQHFEVELTRERVLEIGLKDGQEVRLVPSRLKVFGKEVAKARSFIHGCN